MERYKNKYFSIMGDSISTFKGWIPEGYPTFYGDKNQQYSDIYTYKDTWWAQVIEHFKGKLLVNNSWSGSYVCKPSNCLIESYGCSDERCSNLDKNGISPDYIFVFIGTNDRGACFRLTSVFKEDLSVIENAYALMLDKIKKNYPKAEIWCFTFLKTSCPCEPYFVFPKTQMGVPMERYGEVIISVAKQKGCKFIDLFNSGLVDTIDGLHPNYNGMKAISARVINALEQEQKQ